MRKIYILIALVALFCAAPALAHDSGSHCEQFGIGHPGCDEGGGGGDEGGGDEGSGGGVGGDGGFAAQGQQQGQIGINEQGQIQGQIGVNEQGQDQGQDQGQSQFGINDQGQDQSQSQGQVGIVRDGDVDVDSNDTVNVDASDNSTYKVDNDFPVNTAAPVFAGNCAQGVSAQTMGFGGSVASGNPVCDYIAVAGAYIAGGDRENASRVLSKAEEAADWRFFFARVRMVVTIGLL